MKLLSKSIDAECLSAEKQNGLWPNLQGAGFDSFQPKRSPFTSQSNHHASSSFFLLHIYYCAF